MIEATVSFRYKLLCGTCNTIHYTKNVFVGNVTWLKTGLKAVYMEYLLPFHISFKRTETLVRVQVHILSTPPNPGQIVLWCILFGNVSEHRFLLLCWQLLPHLLPRLDWQLCPKLSQNRYQRFLKSLQFQSVEPCGTSRSFTDNSTVDTLIYIILSVLEKGLWCTNQFFMIRLRFFEKVPHIDVLFNSSHFEHAKPLSSLTPCPPCNYNITHLMCSQDEWPAEIPLNDDFGLFICTLKIYRI